jgi:hypothetical protein
MGPATVGLLIGSVGKVLVGGSTLGYLWTLLKGDESEFKKKLLTAIERSGMGIHRIKKSGEKFIERPKLESFHMVGRNHYQARFTLPIGMTPSDCERAKQVLETATNAEIDYTFNGQTWELDCYAHMVPERVMYDDVVGSPEDPNKLVVTLGVSRRGLEQVNFMETPNPNVLIAGMAGMGKSVELNNIITQLLQYNTELYMIDPKQVELNIYESVPKVQQVVYDYINARKVAREVVKKLKERQELLAEAGVVKIQTYNEMNPDNPIPYTFLIVDEFADFEQEKEFWNDVAEIARRGRALGCYLILCTQRPSHEVLNQQIKANLGVKIALKTSNARNSQIIIDTDRAAKLPMIPGRAILDMGLQREIQVPYLDRARHRELIGGNLVVV